jgi:trehalose 6-phosphate synthase
MSLTQESLRDVVRGRLAGRKLVVVSYREPYVHVRRGGAVACHTPAGGVATALDPVLRACGGTWVAFGGGDADFAVADPRGRVLVPPSDPAARRGGAYTLRRVRLGDEERAGHYDGFANGGLWPLCHARVGVRPVFRAADWRAYRAVNERFAAAVLAEVGRDPAVVLVQDYQLALLPRLLKADRPDLAVAHFWHIPWPRDAALATCRYAGDLLDGLLASDVLAFQTPADARAFVAAAAGRPDTAIVVGDEVRSGRWHRTRVRAIPIGVDAAALDHDALRPVVAADAERLRARLGLQGALVAVGVDRLDYTKGIPERLRAVAKLLERHPRYRGRFSLVQLGPISRPGVAAYRRLHDEVARLADAVNGRFGAGGWRPVHLLVGEHDRDALLAAYRMADVCLVSPLHDGMNLVAKEFVAARPDRGGALVLSRFAGAARELNDAVQVDPRDADAFADAIALALEMPPAEKRRRMDRMRATVLETTVYDWAGELIGAAAAVDGRPGRTAAA